MSERIKWFKDISKDDVEIVGGKGANLGEMTNAGLPIPSGFMVTAQTYKEFIEKTGIKDKILGMIKDLDTEDTSQLQKVAKDIQELIKKTDIPEDIREEIEENYKMIGTHRKSEADEIIEGKEEYVACRSSATAEDLPEASFAGQQATYLNIKEADNVVENVRKCWASLFTARAIYYRKRNDFPTEKVYIAVVVQMMINADKAGVMFSINPSTNDDTEIMIEGAFGLGEAVVSGSVNPDLYIVNKKDLKIKNKEVKEQKKKIVLDEEKGENVEKGLSKEEEAQQVCNDKEIRELARLAKKIEKHYEKPQDMEWAIEGKNVYILQSRAVTTFKKKEETKGKDIPEDVKKVKEVEAKSLVKGETASAGVAAGKVKIIKNVSELNKIKKGDILVTTMTTPDMVPAMQKASAIVTDEGGMTCHAAIVSREMGTPCIVGTGNATKILEDGKEITVHATHGVVYEGRLEEVEKEVEKAKPSAPADIITATQVKVIMDLPDFAEKAAKETNADGVGLVRLEIMIAQGEMHPAEYIRQNKDEEYIKLLMDGMRGIARAFRGKPVWVRTSDMRTDEYRNLKGGDKEPKETDPMIGWHAIRRGLDEPRILKAEFTAIKRLHEEGLKNIGVMLPFVIRTREVREAKKLMRDVGLEPCEDIMFGVMIETPASCWIIEDLCKEGICFVSFGTNDLTQLTLGIDRNNERIAKLFDEMHAGVLGEIKKVVEVCQRYNVETSICGQAGSRPEMAKFLVNIGIDSISANPDAVHDIKEVVARTEKKLLLDAEREEIEEKKK
ncbi:phosphoenolpyruvate synthase [Candidatus Woesearchaeota archaeon]|nr:phosphoenolpyruvate synthase [Candidatus Woesearchaeota archaeon]